MTKSKRRNPSSSISAQIGAMANAAAPLPKMPPHVTVRDRDIPFLHVVLRARLREEWTGPDLVLAAELARVQSDMVTESLLLDQEGTIVRNRFGEPDVNPRQRILDGLSRRSLALMRSMKLAGDAGVGDKRQLGNARALQRQAEALREGLSGESLLA